MFNPVVSARAALIVLVAEFAVIVLGAWLWAGMPGWRGDANLPTITIHMKSGPGPLGRTYSL